MAIIAKYVEPKYPDDLIHLDRWMCIKCGLIFDFLMGMDEIGGISYDPPLDHVNYWMEDGEVHFEEVEYREICQRCGCDLNEFPAIKILVSPLKSLSDIQPLIDKGENVTNEFMVVFPKNAHELTKEIAAFATTQGGKIFLGVNNQGEVIGLQGIDTPSGKDDLQKRIRGLIGNIKPKVELFVDFVSENDKHVALITIPKGYMPFYTSEGKIYIRELDESRPATPEEIMRLAQKQGAEK